MLLSRGMRDYNYFLFDWDGCLGRTLEVWMAAYRQTFRVNGLHPTDKEIASIFGDWEGPSKLGIKDNKQFIERLAQYVHEGSKTIELYPGAFDLLQHLQSQGKHMALLTSSLRPIIEMGLEYNHIESLFEVVLTGEDVTNHKPHPEIIHMAIARMNGNKAESVMIGDSDKDLIAAMNAGIDSVLIYPDSHQLFYDLDELKTHKPTYLFSSFEEFSQELAKK